MEIVQLVEKKVLQFAEIILIALEGGTDYQTLEKRLKAELDNLGVDILKVVLEAVDLKIKQERSMREGYRVVRSGDCKTLLTPFGELTYSRTYYRHQETREYAYLADQKAGITPHMRVEPTVKAELLEGAAHMSYERATLQQSQHAPEHKVSRQSVCTSVKAFKVLEPQPPLTKKQVKYLYIQADEDHIAIRSRRGSQARLIYIHEGYGKRPRRHLKNARYFTSVAQDPLEFWFEVCDYIARHYDLCYLEGVYISGDGASWIHTGLEAIPNATFILDRFHLAKYIITASAHVEGLKRKLFHHIRCLNKEKVMANLEKALELADSQARKERVRKTITYIKNNWEGIKAAIENPQITCSAEGHVSHILSARMSSRPMAWSLEGADKMASMLAVRANKESITNHYLSRWNENLPVLEIAEEVQKQVQCLRAKIKAGKENLGNMPLTQSGMSLTREALQGLKGRQAG